MCVVVGNPLWIQVYGDPVLQVYVTVSEQRDQSPEYAQTPHLMEMVYNPHWKACSPHVFLHDFLRYPEHRKKKKATKEHKFLFNVLFLRLLLF